MGDRVKITEGEEPFIGETGTVTFVGPLSSSYGITVHNGWNTLVAMNSVVKIGAFRTF